MANNSKLQVEWRSPNALTPYFRNSKSHPTEQIDKIAGSIAEFGFDQPITVDEQGLIIKGHGRREAALRLKLEKVPVIVRSDLTESQKKAARIADNRVAQSPWLDEALRLEMEELQDLDFDLGLTGFDSEEIDQLLSGLDGGFSQGNAEEDEETAAELIEQAESGEIESRVKLGQTWQLGRHRICCGDSTNEAVVKQLLGERKVDMVWSDAPYGMNLESEYLWSKGNPKMSIKPSKGYARVIGDDKEFDPHPFFKMFAEVKEQFWWGADYFIDKLPDCGKSGSFIVWDKKNDGLAKVWTNEFELCWSRTRHKKIVIRILWNGALGTESEDIKNRVHPTQKPVRLAERVFLDHGKSSDLIFDPFWGSGMSTIAAERMQGTRTVFSCELSPKYCEVGIQRWEKLSGQTAQLISTLSPVPQ